MENEYDSFKNDRKELKPWQGILLFILVMVSFYTIITWVQMRYGMYGLALTELYLLLLSVGFAYICKADLRAVFPIRKPKLMAVFGTLLMWVSSFALMTPILMTITYFFPRQMYGTSAGLDQVINSVPLVLSVLISAVMPAVCEEALHRGVILHSMKRLGKDWLIVLVMGILFGLFHGSIWRFVPTAILGGVLSYLMVKTENIIYPVIFHFTNNFMPTLLGILVSLAGLNTGASQEQMTYLMENGFPLATLGIYVAMGCVAPFGLYTSAYLIKRSQGERRAYFPGKSQTKRIVTLTLCTVLPVIAGGMLFFYGILFDDSLWNFLSIFSIF